MSQSMPDTQAQSAPATSSVDGKKVLVEVTNLKKYFPIKSGIVFQREVRGPGDHRA